MRALYVLAVPCFFALFVFGQSAVARDIRLEDEQVIAYERAVAPYIAKARATYPAAKKRYLAGLPRGHVFAVMVRLHGIDRAKKEVQQADAFVGVKAIKDGKIYGRIDSPVVISGYKQGDSISFPESEIINWVIQRPDGSEEGNYLGKFMDRYKAR